MRELQALIFDVDGTLADTERDGHRVAFNEAFTEMGLDWHWDESLYGELLAVTGGKERICHYVESHRKLSLTGEALWERASDIHKLKSQLYQSQLKSGRIPLRSGVERLLGEARSSGVRLAIATTTTYENVTLLLASNLGEESVDWFDVIAAGDCVPHKKPAADIYEYALDAMGLQPHNCVALEDSHNGWRSARGAALACVVTQNDYTQHEDLSGASLVVDCLGEPGANPIEVLQGSYAGDMITVTGMADWLGALA